MARRVSRRRAASIFRGGDTRANQHRVVHLGVSGAYLGLRRVRASELAYQRRPDGRVDGVHMLLADRWRPVDRRAYTNRGSNDCVGSRFIRCDRDHRKSYGVVPDRGSSSPNVSIIPATQMTSRRCGRASAASIGYF